MSDKDGKKPGTRDISDLKARLGLKKQGQRATTQGVMPPGAAKAGYIPPPPGAAPPAPPEVAVPDARDDPFGAMNAIASRGAQARGPEIIVVNDGKPVEEVTTAGKGMAYAKLAAMILAPLIVGFLLGGINYERKRGNATLADSKLLFEEFKQIGQSLESLNVVILTAKDRGKGGFGLYDKDLVADVDNLDFKVVDDEQLIVYNANLFGLNRKLVSDTLIFYGRLKLLAQRLKDHQRLTKTSMQKIPPLAAEKVGAPSAFAAILRAPSAEEAAKGGLPQVELVQLGTPLCGDGKEMPQQGCPEGRPASFQVRNDTTAGWQAKGLAGSATEASDKLIFVRPNRIWDAIFEGSQRFADEVQYFQRLSEIETLTTDLIKDRKDIEDRLGAAAARGKAFAL